MWVTILEEDRGQETTQEAAATLLGVPCYCEGIRMSLSRMGLSADPVSALARGTKWRLLLLATGPGAQRQE